MSKQICFITSNVYKVQIAQKSLDGSGFEIIQKKLDTPEIQSDSVEEIASFSAKWASEKTNTAVAVSDSGLSIESLKGFPGPFVKYINKWLTSDDIVRLMRGIENRSVIAIDCLAYCEPGQNPITFVKRWQGSIALTPFKETSLPHTTVDEIFIPDGYNKVQTQISEEEMLNFWSSGNDDPWKQLVKHLQGLSS